MKYGWAMLFPLVLVTGCSSLMCEKHLTRNGGLASQPMMVISRPREFGMDMLGDAKGTASVKKFFCFTIGGDRLGVSLPVIGGHSRDPLETLACYRAAESKGGDAFYVVSSEWEKRNFLCIYRRYTVTVRGKSMKIKDLGEIPPERADNPVNRRN